jgi:predicted  nucleic acid-binding Zn-ribbon protein
MPDKGQGLAARKPGAERFAGTLCAAQAVKTATYDAKTPEKCTKCDWKSPYGDDSQLGHPCPNCGAKTGRYNPATGEIWDDQRTTDQRSASSKTAAYELDDDAKTQMTTMNKDPNKPEDVTEFMDTFKKTSSRSPQFPEACKNCKSLVVPVGYSALREYQHTRLPFCGAEKLAGVGFTAAYFRDCLGYDPIVKDITQKVEMKAPASEQTDKDQSKGMKDKKAEALPSMAPEAVTEHSGHTGHAQDVRDWC